MNKTYTHMDGAARPKPYFLRKLFIMSALIIAQAGMWPVFSQTPAVTLNMRNATIDEVVIAIEGQTDYKFLYNKELIGANRRISVSLRNVSVDSALKTVLTDNGIAYRISNKQIILSVKPSETAQEGVVTGVVTNDKGVPLPGVSILVVGTTRGQTTDINGKYSIAATTDDVLRFSYLGSQTQEIPVGNKSVIEVKLSEDSKELEELVVVGYGTLRKKDLTGAIGSITGDIVADRGTSQLSTSLQGAMPGLTISRTNGAPGETASSITIRGITTLSKNDPLIIIDGTPANNINDVNPNDIENISVLKDAASASIYGARAAAGVILITTKRAKSDDKVSLEYGYEMGIDMPTAIPEYADAVRYMKMVNELRWNDGGNGPNEYPVYAQEEVDNYLALNKQDPNKYPITDWYNLMIKKYSVRNTHRLGITAGTENARMKAAISYDDLDGLTVNRGYERLMVRMNNDVKINKYISAQLDLNFRQSHVEAPISNAFNWVRRIPARVSSLWADGRIAEGRDGSNPYAALMYGGTAQDWYSQYGGRVGLFITPIEGLKISGIVSPTFNTTREKDHTKKVVYYTADDPNELGGSVYDHSKTMLEETRNNSNDITTQLLINYDKSFGSHKISAMAGYELYYYYNESLKASRDNFLLDFPYLDAGPVELVKNEGNAYETGYRSYFGRVMYSFQNRYLLQANVRMDGSSRFASAYRWGSFPSFSAGWVMSEEKFMKNVKPISFLKLRASWGQLGNERIGNYPYQPILVSSTAVLYSGSNRSPYETYAQHKYVMENVTWETTSTMGVGLDAAFLDNRLSLSADWYYKMTKDMLLEIRIPKYTGLRDPEVNVGKMETKGYEIQLGWRDRKNDWSYGVNVHLSDFISRIGKMGGKRVIKDDQVIWNGSYYKEWYGYKSDGLFQTQEEVDAYPTMTTSVKPGDIKYLKKDPNDTTPVSAEKDKVLLGNSQPRYEYGGTAFVSYKGIDLNMTVQGVGYQLAHMTTTMAQPLRSDWCTMPMIIDGKYWSHYNTAEQNLLAEYPRLTYSQASYNYAMSDFWLFNGAYFRLKNVTLGYTLPTDLTRKIFIERMKVYCSMNDLFCISNYPKGWDPETGYNNYPITTTILFGIKINF